MPHDRNGNLLEVGDAVRFDAKVKSVSSGNFGWDAEFEIAAPEGNPNYHPQFTCNTTLCEKALAAAQ